MKYWMIVLMAVAAWFSVKLPFGKTDVAQLAPVNLILVERMDGFLCVCSDQGSVGVGETLSDALADMDMTASGKVYYDTVEYVLLDKNAQVTADELGEYFRPGTFLCISAGEVEPESAARYLKSRELECTLAQYEGGNVILPELTQTDGRYYYHGEGR